MSECKCCEYAKGLEAALLEYIGRYGLTDTARDAFSKCDGGSGRRADRNACSVLKCDVP
jgi:hypothetical protein